MVGSVLRPPSLPRHHAIIHKLKSFSSSSPRFFLFYKPRLHTQFLPGIAAWNNAHKAYETPQIKMLIVAWKTPTRRTDNN